MKLERRFLTDKVEVRSVGGNDEKHIAGYAAKFAPARSEDLGGWVEEIDPHAFDDTLTADVRGLFDHDPKYVFGRTISGTLQIGVDNVGLHYKAVPPKTQWASDLMVSMDRGDIDQSSFGFACIDDAWRVEKDGTVVRTLKKVKLYDVSVITYPAYTDTSSQVRSRFPEGDGKMPEEIARRIEETRSYQAKEKRYRGILGAISSQKWAILPEKLETICALLNARAEGVEATPEEIRAALALQHGDTPEAMSSVAVIPVYGVISQRMSMMEDFSGGTSCESISKQLKAALADDSINTIVLDIDSPGGTVTGIPELAAEIYNARKQKDIIAVANGLAASAAYWIASAATKVVAIPSGEVGSIGVYTTHQDVSGALEKDGVKITFIQAGKYKTDGNPYEPLSESAKEDLQDGVDKFYDMFTRGVAGGRGISQDKVLADYGQGRVLMAQDALAVGMIDEIATFDQVLATLTVAPNNSETPTEFTMPDERSSHSAVEVRGKSKNTKRVDGEDLPQENFAYQGSDALADWKLPIKFSTEAKTVKHIRNAISQWAKTDMPNAEEKKKARSRIKAAAREHGIQLAPGDLAMIEGHEVRAVKADGDDGYDTCQCNCNACMAGNCEHCEDDACTDVSCECLGFDRNATVTAPTAPEAVVVAAKADSDDGDDADDGVCDPESPDYDEEVCNQDDDDDDDDDEQTKLALSRLALAKAFADAASFLDW